MLCKQLATAQTLEFPYLKVIKRPEVRLYGRIHKIKLFAFAMPTSNCCQHVPTIVETGQVEENLVPGTASITKLCFERQKGP